MEVSIAKRVAMKLMNFTLNAVNRHVDVRALQKKYHAPGGKVMVLDLADIPLQVPIVIQDGAVRFADPKVPPNAVVRMRLRTFLAISKGRDALGRPLDFRTAWAHGLVEMEGASGMRWLSDAVLFNDLYALVQPRIAPYLAGLA